MTLKDTISKSTEKQVVTTLPNKVNPTNVNYHEGNSQERERSKNVEEVLWQMDQII